MVNKIERVYVENLFGFLNHDVKLKDDGVTFIHGPNGCGKTTFLKLIAAFLEWDLTVLNSVFYDKLKFYYTNDEIVEVTKSTKEKKVEDETIELAVLNFKLFVNTEEKEDFTVEENRRAKINLRRQIEENLPFLHRIAPNMWLDELTGEHVSHSEIAKKYSKMLPFTATKKRAQWLQNLQQESNLHFIQTQRLLKVNYDKRSHRRDDYHISNVIELYSNELKAKISNKLAESAAVSQTKDRSFPERLLSLELDPNLSEQVIRNDYKKTEEKIEKLMNTGLINQEKNISLPAKEFEATEKKVLSLYLKDINEKLSVFDDLLLRIETFLDIVSSKLMNKTFKVSREEGFLIETIHGGQQKLNLSELSSGEQHQIVLFYELIFKTSDNSFFLIDEPEISLHVDWQRQFLDDISKIAQLGKHSFIIATHSPQIIGHRRDLAVALDGGILSE